MNAAFRSSIEAPDTNRLLPCEPTVSEAEPTTSDVLSKSDERSDVTDIKGMSANNIRRLLWRLSQEAEPLTPALHPKVSKAPVVSATPSNRFQGLAIEETPEEVSDPPLVTEASCEKQPRRPQWERKLPKQLKIGAAEVGPNSLYLQVEIESTDTQRKYGVRALVDLGATGLFIDREYVKSRPRSCHR
jgi:hypothetical protein